MSDSVVTEAFEIVRQCRLILAGRSSGAQSAALADLLAMWLAGHSASSGDPAASDAVRENLLAAHVDLVRRLIPPNVARIHGRPRA